MSIKVHFNNELSKNTSISNGIKGFIFEPKRRGLFYYRIAKEWYDNGRRLFPKMIQNRLLTMYGCDISLSSDIGQNVRFRHINGIVIGKGVTIGDNTVIYHQVTIGGKNLGDAEKNRYPVIGKDVTLFAGAKIIGDITIGDHAVIGANSVVLHDVAPYSIVAGIPAKEIGRSQES